jgi:hypothetical protein
MIELIEELRRRDVAVTIVSGGGTEFLRAVSEDLYGVPPEAVVGTLIAYDYSRGEDGAPRLLRTGRVAGVANEGAAKVSNIQSQLGRRPRLVAGNSAVTGRCSSGRRPVTARAWPCWSTTTTPSGSSAT